MARLARVVVTDVPHHITQRGNARQVVFGGDADRLTYLGLLGQYCELYRLSLLGYCLMSNHVHLVVVPRTAQSLAQALKHTHGRYAAYRNAGQHSSGHLWQGRFYSCPLDDAHLWIALRYVELNLVRARMVAEVDQWRWSSAAAHCGLAFPQTRLDLEVWQRRWSAEEWVEFLAAGESPTELTALRQFTHNGRPLGSAAFVAALEQSTQRLLAPRNRGRRPKPTADSDQYPMTFVA
ncbi:MAG: transposase [Terriglobales bacterium]